MSNRQNHFNQIINKLEAHYGASKPPTITDPFHLLLYENIAYLADDTKRDAAFAALKKEVGLKPTDILSASTERLVGITKLGGIHAELRAARLKEVAHIVLNEFQGDLESVLRLPLPKAIKALRQFPSIGEPGAEKVLLFTGTYPVLALESNGLRVLLRALFGEERKDYAASYRSVQKALQDQIGTDCKFSNSGPPVAASTR